MTALWVILGICLFVLFLLLCPVTVAVDFENEFAAKVGFLFVKVQVFPRPEKEQPEKKEKTEKKEKKEKVSAKSKIRGILEQKGLSGFLNMIREFASIATDAAKKWISHLVIDRIYLDVTVADEDAAQAAILYGEVCAGVYTPMGILLTSLKCKEYHINVVPDFQKKKCEIRFSLKIHILLLFLLAPALKALVQSLKIIKTIRQTSEN
jgi:Protein of unknown function (DUF2953).